MAKSDSRFEYRADLSRTDHDLSQRRGFTSTSGMLLPIWEDIATPGDSYYMHHDMPLLRSANLAAPAMVEVKVHFDTFFVPFQMVYQPAENTFWDLKPLQSNFYNLNSQRIIHYPLWNYSAYVTDILTNHMTDEIHAEAFRLADLLGYCPDNFTSSSATYQTKYAPSFFPWKLLTYHTIFNYFYRLDDKTDFDNTYCNWDSYYSATSAITTGLDMMQIHQRPWHFDYFSSMYRSPLVSDANMQNFVQMGYYSYLTDAGTAPIKKDGTPDPASNNDIYAFSSQNPNTYAAKSLNTDFGTAAIRQMFANEKLAMITGRTRKNYDSQVLAHFGVNVPHDVKHDLTLIHHDEYDLNVQEVTSLASTNDAPLGELAGKSYAAGKGKEFKFTAPCHGFIMTIFSIEPRKRYIGGFDRINDLTGSFDIPTPEYDRLGNMPMFRYECGFNITQTGFANSDIIGWKERYYYNKRKQDKATIAFDCQGVGTNVYSSYMLANRPFAALESAANYVQQRPDLEGRFYIERNAVDNLCLVNYSYGWKHSTDTGVESWSNSPWMAYSRDPFIVNSFIKCKKISWLSKDGEPIYNY